MTDEKPLHVRVAEALGCQAKGIPAAGYWTCECPRADAEHGFAWPHGSLTTGYDGLEHDPEIAAYDTDWSATGPLIERYVEEAENHGGDGWYVHGRGLYTVHGQTLLVATCNLILALKAAGKLD